MEALIIFFMVVAVICSAIGMIISGIAKTIAFGIAVKETLDENIKR